MLLIYWRKHLWYQVLLCSIQPCRDICCQPLYMLLDLYISHAFLIQAIKIFISAVLFFSFLRKFNNVNPPVRSLNLNLWCSKNHVIVQSIVLRSILKLCAMTIFFQLAVTLPQIAAHVSEKVIYFFVGFFLFRYQNHMNLTFWIYLVKNLRLLYISWVLMM